VPDHQRGQPSTTQAQPPRSALPDWVLHGEYNGPSPKAPANLRTAADMQNPEVQRAAQLAATQARAAVEAARAFSQRVMRGDRSLPNAAEQRNGRAYSLTNQQPPRRGGLMERLGLLGMERTPDADLAAIPEPSPSEAPDGEPSSQAALCAIYSIAAEGTDGYGDALIWGQALNICGTTIPSDIRNMAVSMHFYKCSAYWVSFNICMVPIHWYELWPPCERATNTTTYLWCGPSAFYPYSPGGYFLRAYGHVDLWSGASGGSYQDSYNVAFQCEFGAIPNQLC